MASGKSRSTKRSSGTSYSSTTTIVIFIALSLLFLWLLTSNSFAPPQSTSRPATKKPIKPIARSRHSENEVHHVDHEDIPTHLPDDDTIAKSTENANEDSSNNNNNNNKETRVDQKDVPSDPDVSNDSNNDDEPKPDNGDKARESSLEQEEEEEEKEEEKHMALKSQTSDESSTTQKQEVEQTTKDDENQHDVDSKNDETKKAETSNEHEITDEDQQQRIDEHQQREDDQVVQTEKQEWRSRDPHGAISRDQIEHDEAPIDESGSNDNKNSSYEYTWKLCNGTAGADYIPCLDNEKVIAKIHERKHHEHRERHCPEPPPTCLVPVPKGYRTPIEWPQSRDKIWYHNVPHTTLAQVKGHQNWVKVTGEFLTFPGGGTQFIHGALHYIDFLQEAVPDIAWGRHSRVVLDVGCGVASLGGYLFDRDVLTMSFAPKDEHEAQVQMALERGVPAISAVMGSQRLPFPSRVFDVVHCARCRVPWHADGGALLLELNRVLRPGGYFVWSATPVYQKLEEDVQIWKEMSNLTVAMCWELVTIKKDTLNSIGAAIYQKPDSNDCYEKRKQNNPPMCKTDDDPNAAWYVPLQPCMHRAPLEENERGSQWPEEWPDRLQTPPYWLNGSQVGVYGKPARDDFASDYKHWKKMVSELYMNGLGISWSHVRNVMDMRAVYGGFAAALKDLKVWVMNVVNVDSPDTLPIIYERGLFGIYHDWCESFSTYPRTYDLLHADHLFSTLKRRCKLVVIMAEIDRIVRPGGKLIVRDDSSTVGEVEDLLKSLHWEVYFLKNQEGILGAQKSDWRPNSYADPS